MPKKPYNPGKDKYNLTVHAHEELRDFITACGSRVGMSASKYARKILQHWVASGCPSVCAQDAELTPPEIPSELIIAIEDWYPHAPRKPAKR